MVSSHKKIVSSPPANEIESKLKRFQSPISPTEPI
jgi:hypothetical protein